jgi:hypothetical protein
MKFFHAEAPAKLRGNRKDGRLQDSLKQEFGELGRTADLIHPTA